MKYLFSALILFVSLCSNAKDASVSYSFSYDTLSREMHVKVRFQGSPKGKTELKLPDSWAGQSELFRAVTKLSVHGANAFFEPLSDSVSRTIVHKPNAKLLVEYTLKQDWEGEVLYPSNFRAVLQKQFVQFVGNGLLVIPGTEGERIHISLDWSGLPENWKIVNSFHSTGRKYSGKVLKSDFLNSLFVAGDFRTYKTSVGGKPVYVAVRGNEWKFTDSVLVDRVKVIVAMERRFWNDASENYYCVSLIPFADFGSANGTSLNHAFMLAMGYDQPLQDWLLTHEYFHRWNGTTIRIREDIEQEHSWFTEGFTEYYSYRLLYENGISSQDEYLQQVNDMIAAYYLSSVRNEDRITQGKNYWGSRDYQQIPYKKGFVYALWLDQKIRSQNENHTLDDLMFELNKIEQQKDSIPYPVFVSLVSKYAGNISEAQKKYIDDGETIPVLSESLGKGFSIEQKEMGEYDAGFDIDATLKTNIVEGVVVDGPAWNAGLRNGQKAKGYSIYRGNATFPAEITIEENGARRVISFLPMSNKKIPVPQFVKASL